MNPCKMVVLDNTKHGILYWKENIKEHYHIPRCTNVSEMFNWYLDEIHPKDDLYYMDDDVDINTDSRYIMQNYLKNGWDLIVNSKIYVTYKEQSALNTRKIKSCGSGWMVSKNVLMEGRFDGKTKEGVYKYMNTLVKEKGVNTKTIWKPLMNLLVHDNNEIWTPKMFETLNPKIPKITF